MRKHFFYASSLLMLMTACTEEVGLLDEDSNFGGRGGDPLKPVMDIVDRSLPPANPLRNAYFGDLHVHTEYSFDAYNFGTTATPYDAYRFAQGEAIAHPAGYQIQMATPLDFYAVTDHAMFLGLALEAGDTTTPFSQYEISKPLHNLNADDNKDVWSLTKRLSNFASFIPGVLSGIRSGRFRRKWR